MQRARCLVYPSPIHHHHHVQNSQNSTSQCYERVPWVFFPLPPTCGTGARAHGNDKAHRGRAWVMRWMTFDRCVAPAQWKPPQTIIWISGVSVALRNWGGSLRFWMYKMYEFAINAIKKNLTRCYKFPKTSCVAVEHSRLWRHVGSSAADLDVIIKSRLELPAHTFHFVCLEFVHTSFFRDQRMSNFPHMLGRKWK